MKLKKTYLVLILISILFLTGSVGMTLFLLFSNYQNVRLFKAARDNFERGNDASVSLAEAQLLQVIRNDSDNEDAYRMLGEIAARKKVYPEQVYYCYRASRLNPLNKEYRDRYVRSLCFARYFDRLETFLVQETSLNEQQKQLLLYAAGRNGSIKKYPVQLDRRSNNNKLGELALLLFEHKHLTTQQKLHALDNFFKNDDAFLQQEVLAAQAELYLKAGKIDEAEKALQKAYGLNEFAFAPALGRFYANFRSFGKALEVFEKYLKTYHDQALAMQTAEIYCLLNQTDKITTLRNSYQADSGNSGMLFCYYLDALTALAKNDMVSLKELTEPLRDTINTPLASFMFLCADLQGGSPSRVLKSYSALLAHRNYLDLQNRADNMLLQYLKNSFNGSGTEEVLPLATLLYKRKPDAFTAKLILLAQKKSSSGNLALLRDALKQFSSDQGVVKIGIEYFLKHDPAECERLIVLFKKKFPGRTGDMLRYEVILALQKGDHAKVSELFRKNFSPEILPEYWNFASSAEREEDLRFLSRDKRYAPFCQALLKIKKKERSSACDLLEKADAQGNQALLFFAARTLAENGRNKAALKKYAEFPENSPYKIAVLLNTSELCAENGDMERALALSQQAYSAAPELPETQLCYADKLFRKGKLNVIPAVIKLSKRSSYRRQLKTLWIAGMQQRIKECDLNREREKVRELCRQLLAIAPDNAAAAECIKKLNKMPQ